MAKPSGIKATDFIDRTARWFGRETGWLVFIEYHTHYKLGAGSVTRFWELRCWFESDLYFPVPIEERFASFTAMRSWMDAEIRRRRILFRDYRG